MHVNSEVVDTIVDTVVFSAFFAQARQSRPSEVTWKPERCSWVQFCPGEKVVLPKQGYSRPGENGPGASVLSKLFSPKRDNFRSSEGILAQATLQKNLDFLF